MNVRKRRRAKAEIERDRRRIADLYLQGRLQAEIAIEVGLAQSTVSRDLSILHKHWLESSLVDFSKAKAKEIAKIDRLEREYWNAWLRSLKDAEMIMEKAVETASEIRKEATQTARGQSGDPRFLQGIQWCIDKRCKIIGIDAATKFIIDDWREQAVKEGVDVDSIYSNIVEEFTTAMVGQDDARSMGGGEGGGEEAGRGKD